MPGENNYRELKLRDDRYGEKELYDEERFESEPVMFRPARLGWMKQVYRSEMARELGTYSINNSKDLEKDVKKEDKRKK